MKHHRCSSYVDDIPKIIYLLLSRGDKVDYLALCIIGYESDIMVDKSLTEYDRLYTRIPNIHVLLRQ